MSYPSSLLFPLGVALLLLSPAQAIPLDGLISNSPFVGPSPVGAQPANPETANVEFRGVIASRDGTVFGLYDRSRNQGAWVRQNESGADFNVLAYDEANAVVSLVYQGQKLSLSLSPTKIETAAPSYTPQIAAAPMGAPTTVNGASPNDQRKLEAIATEVRRRRALRQSTTAVAPTAP